MDDGAAANGIAIERLDTALTLVHAPADDCHSEPIHADDASRSESAPLTTPRLVSDEPDVDPPQIVEALLFASDAPISLARLTELVGSGTQTEVRCWIADLNLKYKLAGLSFQIEEIARGYQMLTLPAFRPWLAKLEKQRTQSRLSDAALEALAIVAYKQPIIRADVEAIRGVACGDVLNRLREAGLIKIVGRAEVVGRPMLYGTTRKFLDQFGLANLDDLPPMEALTLRRGPALVSPPPDAPNSLSAPQPAESEARAAAGA